MKYKFLDISIFALSLISLAITLKLLWNLGIFADEYNISTSSVFGGDFWLIMYWVRLAIITVIAILSGMRVFQKN